MGLSAPEPIGTISLNSTRWFFQAANILAFGLCVTASSEQPLLHPPTCVPFPAIPLSGLPFFPLRLLDGGKVAVDAGVTGFGGYSVGVHRGLGVRLHEIVDHVHGRLGMDPQADVLF